MAAVCGPSRLFAVLACVSQASPRSLLQNLPLEGGENGQHGSSGPPGGRGQIHRRGYPKAHEAPPYPYLDRIAIDGDQFDDRKVGIASRYTNKRHRNASLI